VSDRLVLMIDLERCTGCKSCEAACKQEHRLGPGEYRNKVIWSGSVEEPALSFLTLTCQQCERPACLRACPVNPKAIAKDAATGVVSVIEDRCTGCGECVIACPYGAMGYDPRGHHALKCDLCSERRAEGLTTACASACPTRAISLGHRDVLLTRADAEGRHVRAKDPFLLGPGTIYLEQTARKESPLRPAAAAGAQLDEVAQYPYGSARADAEPDRVEAGGCNICFNCCSTKFHFRGDELVKITGNDEDRLLRGRVCPKSQLTLQLHRSPHRLRYPQKRVGARGEGRFKRISWEQALDEIADKLKAIRQSHGAEALAMFIGTRTGMLDTLGYTRLFAQLWGTPNHEGTDPFCASGKNIAYELTQGRVGSGNSYTPEDLGSAQLYLYLGDNQAETRPVYFSMINDWRLRNRAKMVVVDPRLTVTASKADRWLAIRPGTDMALALAMSHHILDKGLYNARFCAEWMLGFDEWRDFLFARGYTPEWAEPVTGIDAAEIRRLAEEVAAADGCVVFASRGVNQHTNGTQTNRALMFLAAITGNWGRHGGAFFNMSHGTPIAPDAPPERRPKISRPRVRRSPTGWTEAMTRGRPYPIKALIACNNPLAQWPGQDAARAAFSALELLVHIELFPNETSAFADYVLPAATGIEKGEIGRGNDDRRIVWIDKMIEPPGEAKADGWIWIELGKRLGMSDVLKEAWKDPRVFWDEACIDNDLLRGVTQKRLHSVPWRWVRQPVASESEPEVDTLYLEGTEAAGAPPGHRFPTPSGKLEFWTEAMEAKFSALGLSALPEFYAERESLADLPWVELLDSDADEGVTSPFSRVETAASRGRIVAASPDSPGARLRAQGFDTELITGRPPAAHFHSLTHYFWQAQEMWPDLYCQIHPDKAARLGIADGARMRIETAHGAIEAVAWLHAGIRPEAVFIPIGWGERQPYHPWRSVNFLTDKTQRDPVSDQTNLKALLCRVSVPPRT